MTTTDLVLPLLLMLVGGLATSIGGVQFARSARGRAALGRIGPVGFGGLAAVSFAVPVAVGYVFWSRVSGATDMAVVLDRPLLLLGFGAAVGLPMGLPGLMAVWSEVRPSRIEERERKRAESTADDRARYATELATRMRDASGDERTFVVEARGAEGRVLWLEGDLERAAGERLVAALRADLEDHGFNRVECRSPHANWWVPV